MCVTFVTCEVRVCGLRCHSGSSLYIYRVYLDSTIAVSRLAGCLDSTVGKSFSGMSWMGGDGKLI